MNHIILASGSPRRKELLEQIGIEFEIIPAVLEEIISSTLPVQVVTSLSLQKASEVASSCQISATIIGADTIVCFNDQILGKPLDKSDAFRMLTMLQGNTHSVFTGVTLIQTTQKSSPITFFEETKVTMYPMSESEITAYIETKEPMDKAGAYAIQGKCAAYIKGIEGDYNNVVGLPIARLYQILKTL